MIAHGDAAQLAAVLGAAGAVLVLLARSRWPLLGGFGLLAIAETVLAIALVPTSDLRLIVDRPAVAGAAGLAAVVVIAGATLFVRYPAVGTVALLVAAPFRVPVDLGETEALQLVPI